MQEELYTKGIVQSQLRNIERTSQYLDVSYHGKQHFTSESKRNAREVIGQVAREVSHTLPNRKPTGLIVDESGWAKKGTRAYGLAGNIVVTSGNYPIPR